MKLDCGIIKDLLPLYSDEVCSEESRAAVEEHLKECEACAEELRAIGDNKSVSLLRREGDSLVIGKYRRLLFSKILFFLVCALIIPFVNGIFAAATGDAVHETVLITIVSMLAFVFIPAVVRKKRFVWLTVSAVLAPAIEMLNFGTFDRLFDHFNNTWEYDSGVLVILLLPSFAYIIFSAVMFIVNREKKPADPFLYRRQALKVVITETFCLYYGGYISVLKNMMSEGYSDIIRGMVWITVPVFFLWTAFLVFRFCRKNIFIRLGAYSVILGVYLSIDSFIKGAYHRDFSSWLPILAIGLAVAAIFFITGVIWERSKEKNI